MKRRQFLAGTVGITTSYLISPSAAANFSAKAKHTQKVSVVLPERASVFEQDAANELQSVLDKTLGLKVDMAPSKAATPTGPWVSIGQPPRAEAARTTMSNNDLPPEGYRIFSNEAGDGLYLFGNGLGYSYGVFHILKHVFGVQWPVADPQAKRLMPSSATTGLPDSTSSAPSFRIRWIGTDAWSYFHGANVNVSPSSPQMWRAAHSLYHFVPKKTYLRTHPEYFAPRSRKRRRPHVCTTNPEVIDLVIKGASKKLANNPNLHAVTVYPDDGLGFCECKRCKSLDEPGWATVEEINRKWDTLEDAYRYGALSRRMTIFYIKVGEALQRLHPSRKVMVGAYGAYLLPPKDKSLRVPDNLILSLAHGKCHNHTLADVNCPDNSLFHTALNRWKRLYQTISIYEYYVKLANLNLPFPIIHTIRHDIPFYFKNGIRELYSQYSDNYYVDGANYYLALKLLWNVEQDPDAVMATYYQGLYGKAATLMEEYWNNFEQAAIKSDAHTPWPLQTLRKIFTDSLLQQQGTLLSKARQMARHGWEEEVLRRTDIVHTYTVAMMRYIDQIAEIVTNSGTKKLASTTRISQSSASAQDIEALIDKAQGLGLFRKSNYIKRMLRPETAISIYYRQSDSS